LKNGTVRCHACPAAAASKRGAVSLFKPCCVPGYLKASKRLPLAFSAVS